MSTAGVGSPSRSDSKMEGSVALRPPRHRPPRPQKLFPEQVVELPKVLQQPTFRANLQQPTCSSARPGSRTHPCTPCCFAPSSTPPLIVRSMVVTPRTQNRMRSVAALSAAQTRQKSASPSAQLSYIVSLHSPDCSLKPGCQSESALGGLRVRPPLQCEVIATDLHNLVGGTISDKENWRDRSAVRRRFRLLSGNLLTKQSSSDGEDRESEDQDSTGLSSNSDGVGQQFRNTDQASDQSGDEILKKPSCKRNLARELEKELTFKPELNQRSLKIASRSTRQCVPLVCRLTERRKKAEHSAYSFAPHINPHSIKLAQERAGKIDEVSEGIKLSRPTIIIRTCMR